MRVQALLSVAVLAAVALSGCAADQQPTDTTEVAEDRLVSIFDRIDLPFNTTGPWSYPLLDPVYDVLDPISVFVDIELPVTEGGAVLDPTDPPKVHMGLFLPDIGGCDFTDVEVSVSAGIATMHSADNHTHCEVPVIADVGPYYGESDVEAEERGSGRLGEFLISNFVPQGYAVAQISVLGSGKSNHCFDMFGLAEQLGVSQAVEWLGDQEWSNGNVGLIGRSYDGSTPWMAAAHSGPDSALKTIVPISGLSGLGDLVQWNGAMEARGLLFHNVVYGTFGLGEGQEMATFARHTATCPDWLTATPWGAASYLTGDDVVDVDGTYWEERHFIPGTLANYEGSVYMTHGLIDDNVDPHAGWIAQDLLTQNGNDVRGMWGQWGHNYPDRVSEHAHNARMDWAQDLLEWFDHYLMEAGPAPALHNEVELVDGRWVVTDGLRPSNEVVLELASTDGSQLTISGLQGSTVSLGTLDAAEETIVAGLSTVSMSVTPTGPGGQVYVEFLVNGESQGLSYGITELRHVPGGSENPPVPGLAMDIEIPLQLFGAAIQPGDELSLRVAGFGNDFLPSPVLQPVLVDGASIMVHLSTLPASQTAFFTPPMPEATQE